MAHLSFSCLGPFRVELDGQPVTEFKSNKVRALLTYLAVEADRPHHREVLAGLLWPGWPDRSALSNLRYSLSNLRRVIGDQKAKPPYLLISRETLQFNASSDHWLDVTAFLDETKPLRKMSRSSLELTSVEEAVTLYRGDFLEGFSIKDSVAFEEWVQIKRQQIAQQLLSALRYLLISFEKRGQFEQAQNYARRQIELEPWDESAHQVLMRTLTLSGQRSAALVQYESCRQLLAEELGIEPTPETSQLYEQIRTGKLQAFESHPVATTSPVFTLPAFLEEEAQVDNPIFVARERELAQLAGFLGLAAAGQGRAAFVTGEAGSGKTALLQDFSRRSQEVYVDLVIAVGNCNAYTGIGDPYLPFREILGLLTGDVEAQWSANAIASEHALRLWNTLPFAAQALMETGRGLIDTFVPRTSLVERIMTYTQWPGGASWRTQLEKLQAGIPVDGLGAAKTQQSDLFEQYTKVLQALAQRGPLLLLVDDLQWADPGSISLLFHLGRHLVGSRILILGAYRPEEVDMGRDGKRHPLKPVVNEFQLEFGDVAVNVDRAERREFLESFLDSQPNSLGTAFRDMLYRITRGHPLFTIELLRGMQERGDLVHDSKGRLVEGPSLDWKTLPVRVEAAIAERIGRLAKPLRDALRVASVEGEDFTAEVVARVLGTGERDMVSQLSAQLDRRHRLVRPTVIERTGIGSVSRYRFRNYLFQKYLYDNLDHVERVYLHKDVAAGLEEIYGDQVSDIAVQLAWHFQEAGIAEKAISYLRQAGEKAAQLSAYQEGITHLTKALSLLMELPDSTERARQELALQLALGMAWQGVLSARAPEVKQTHVRAYELCQQTGQTAQLCLVLGEMVEFHYVGAEYQKAHELAEESLTLAKKGGDPLLVALSHWYLGYILFGLGEFTSSRTHLEQVSNFYKPHEHHQAFVSLRGKDPGLSAVAYDACCLWCLGYPKQALERSQEALSLARDLNHPFSLAEVHSYAGCVINEMRRDPAALKENAEELIRISDEKVPGWRGSGICYRGEALTMTGQVEEGIIQILEGLSVKQSIDARCYLSGTLCTLAWAQGMAGRNEEALDTLAETLAFIEETDERYFEAELYHLRGEVLQMQGKEAEGEASFQKAIEIAHRQNAKAFELRAVTTMARLWQKQDRTDDARLMLEQIYSWFTEGFDTPDLIEAKALLEDLSQGK